MNNDGIEAALAHRQKMNEHRARERAVLDAARAWADMSGPEWTRPSRDAVLRLLDAVRALDEGDQ